MQTGGIAVVLCVCAPLIGQHRVDPRNMYERVLCVVPMVGAGTPDDPRRPEYAPLPPKPGDPPPSGEGIIAFMFQLSDDGNYALAEFVARDRAAFKDLLADARPFVKAFVKGKHKREDVETEFKKLKKDFDIDSFGVVVP